MKIFFRTAASISTKLGSHHPWIMGMHDWSNEGSHERGYNSEITNIHDDMEDHTLFQGKITMKRFRYFFKKFARNTGSLTTRLCRNIFQYIFSLFAGFCPNLEFFNLHSARIVMDQWGFLRLSSHFVMWGMRLKWSSRTPDTNTTKQSIYLHKAIIIP